MDVTDEYFYQQWGDKIVFTDEKRYQKFFKTGFNLWVKHDKMPAERVVISWCQESPHFIISPEQKMQGFIGFQEPFVIVLNEIYVQPYSCKKTDRCGYTCKNLWKLKRHEAGCTSETKMTYRQKVFGNQEDVRSELIRIGVIDVNDKTYSRFISFDIESVNKEVSGQFGVAEITGAQRVISIGYYANFGDYRGVIFREDMSEESGLRLVKQFLDKMYELQTRHYEQIPQNIKEIMREYKEQLKVKTLSVENRAKFWRRLCYLRSLTKLKIVGFNSGGYDLPCLMNMIIQIAGPDSIKVIKKGNSIFDLNVKLLSFRDCSNYTGPMSLSKFAEIFKLPISKSIFPYEAYSSISEIRDQIDWPSYPAFQSSLPTKKNNHVAEISQILVDKNRFGFSTFGDFMEFFNVPTETFSCGHFDMLYLPNLNPNQQHALEQHFNVSPINYIDQKKSYESRIQSGEYTCFLDYLGEYNLLDCDLLTAAMTKFMAIFEQCFKLWVPPFIFLICKTFYNVTHFLRFVFLTN